MGFKARKKPVNDFSYSKRDLDEINEQRWEYDLPPISHREKYRRDAEYMDEHYGYDIGK